MIDGQGHEKSRTRRHSVCPNNDVHGLIGFASGLLPRLSFNQLHMIRTITRTRSLTRNVKAVKEFLGTGLADAHFGKNRLLYGVFG